MKCNVVYRHSRAIGVSGILLAMVLGLSGCGATDEDVADFPTGDIRMIVTYEAGGATDATGRAVAAGLEEQLGVSVVVENVAGGAGSVGTTAIANADADGYTIGTTTASAVSRVPILQNVSYDLDDLHLVTMAMDGGGLLAVRADSEYETAEEFLEAAEENPDSVQVATPGAQSPQHVELDRLSSEHGISFRTVPFEGDAPAATALIGGNVDAVFSSNADLFVEYIESGDLRPLILGVPDQVDYGVEVPTFEDLGYDDIVYGQSDYLIVAPQGIPEEIASVFDEALEAVISEPEYAQRIGEAYVPEEYYDSEALSDFLSEEQEVLRPILEDMSGES